MSSAPPTGSGSAPAGRPLPRSFFVRPPDELALALLGVRLVRRWDAGGLSTGLIVEVEAYGGPEDRASHARFGPTRRNATMFGSAGHAYLYRVYGLHMCLNVVGAAEGEVGAVLVRAVMPEAGVEALTAGRARAGRTAPGLARLAAGPGNVSAAFGLGLALDGLDLTRTGAFWLTAPDTDLRAALLAPGVVRGPRVGVEYAGPPWTTLPWRFGVRGHPALSRPFPRGA
jgi:DNA-3-methyladenine glycosylase